MRKILGSFAATALVIGAGAASAGEWTGTVEKIDPVGGNITVSNEVRPEQDMIFAVSDTNTVGATINDLQEGDQVTVFFAGSDTESGMPVNAMQIDVVAEAGAMATAETAEMEGEIEAVDEATRTMMVGGKEFVVGEDVVVMLADLEPGDQVRIVYVDAGADQSEAVEVMKVE